MIIEEGNVAHYSRQHHLKNILDRQEIILSPVGKLADPREGSLEWIYTLGYGDGPDHREREYAEDLKKGIGTKLRIFCTASKKKLQSGGCPIETSMYGRPRMWSQYGDNSEGFCVIFNKERLNSRIDDLVTQPEHLISGEVQYYEWLHLVNGSSTIEYGQNIHLRHKNVFEIINQNRMLHSIYMKKSIDWRDECEFRWLVYNELTEPLVVSIGQTVEAVVLGCKFPTERFNEAKKYSERLSSPCYVLDYQHPKYQLMKV